jgi:hypothetical protein
MAELREHARKIYGMRLKPSPLRRFVQNGDFHVMRPALPVPVDSRTP